MLNVTPDSFSDGGNWAAPLVSARETDDAVARGLVLLREGADVVDVGGESTRPGAERVDPAEELRRVLPVVSALVAAGAVVSIDTMRAEVARAALSAGAQLVNDVSGGLADPEMARVVAEADCAYVATHWRGHSTVMADRALYRDPVAEVVSELEARLAALAAAGVDPARVVLDPGIGFAKRPEHNWALLGQLDRLAALGRPLLVGVSRKRFLGALLAGTDGTDRPVAERDVASAVLAGLLAASGVWAVRAHAVRATLDAVRVAGSWRAALPADG